MSHPLLLPDHDHYTLADLLSEWDRGTLSLEEVLERWPHPDATREELLRELLRVILGLRARMSAIDGIGDTR